MPRPRAASPRGGRAVSTRSVPTQRPVPTWGPCRVPAPRPRAGPRPARSPPSPRPAAPLAVPRGPTWRCARGRLPAGGDGGGGGGAGRRAGGGRGGCGAGPGAGSGGGGVLGWVGGWGHGESRWVPPARGVSAETDGAPQPPLPPRGCSATARPGGSGGLRPTARPHAGWPGGLPAPSAQRDIPSAGWFGTRRAEPTPHPEAFRTVCAGPPAGGGRRHRAQVSAPRERRGKECAAGCEQRWDSPGTATGTRRIRCQAAPGTAPASPPGSTSRAGGEEEGPSPVSRRILAAARSAAAAGWGKAVRLHSLPTAGAAPRQSACSPGRRCQHPQHPWLEEREANNLFYLETRDARCPPGPRQGKRRLCRALGVKGADLRQSAHAPRPLSRRRLRRAQRMGKESPPPRLQPPGQHSCCGGTEPQSQTS